MTVATELAKENARLEWILCIEGVGWPSDEFSLSGGFDGDVFVTNDLNGDLASILGCTIHKGLALPRSISDSYDPKTLDWTTGGLVFDIADVDEWWLSNFKPNWTSGTEDTLAADLAIRSWTLRIDNATNTWSNGDTIWVGGREKILLAGRTLVSGTTYRYDTSTRGYLGTPTGFQSPIRNGVGEFSWKSGTAIHNWQRYWRNRRILLFAHVPGETVANVERMYFGRLSGVRRNKVGTVVSLNTVYDRDLSDAQEWEHPGRPKARQLAFVARAGAETVFGDRDQLFAPPTPFDVLPDERLETSNRVLELTPSDADFYEENAIRYAYAYRNYTTGGTVGVPTASDTAPQAYTDGDSRERLDKLCRIGNGQYLRLLYRRERALGGIVGGTEETHRRITAESVNTFTRSSQNEAFPPDTPVQLLLDNFSPNIETNPFTLNGKVRTHPIDVFLMFMLSTNDEFFIGTGTTADQVTYTFSGSPFSTNEWNGYALHFVNGNNVGEAREITATATGSLTVAPSVPNTDTAKECQIRNSIYDRLPLGWGLGVPWQRIDIDAWEALRDNELQGASLGNFAIGDAEKLNVREILYENILKPFGILPVVDRSTGKLVPKYIGNVGTDSTITAPVTVVAADLIDVGEVDELQGVPVHQVDLKVRKSLGVLLNAISGTEQQTLLRAGVDVAVNPSVTEGLTNIEIKPEELDTVFDLSADREVLEIKAGFNSENNINWLVGEATARLRLFARPPPLIPLRLHPKHLTSVAPGDVLQVTDTTKWNPANQYTGSRGWTTQLMRVLGVDIAPSSGPAFSVQVMHMLTKRLGRVAPAMWVESRASDGNGHYFVMESSFSLTQVADDKDYYGFAVGDVINWYDNDFTVREGTFTIKAFGSNQATDPTSASDDRVYINETPTAASADDTFIAFDSWSNSNTSNMDVHVALADEATDQLTGGDEPFDFG